MDNERQKALLEEFQFLSGLLKKHEAAKKEEKTFTVQQKCKNLPSQKLNANQPSHHPYKLVNNPTGSLIRCDKKYSIKSHNPDIVNQKSFLNKGFKAKYQLVNTNKNQTSKDISLCDKIDFKGNANKGIMTVPKKIIGQETEPNKTFKSCDEPHKINSRTKFMKEVESLTELLKKKTSENKLLHTTKKDKNMLQNKLLNYTCDSKKYRACNEYNSENFKSVLPKIESNVVQKVIPPNNPSLKNVKLNKNCYSKLNLTNQTKHSTNSFLPKPFNFNEYSYKKVNSGTENLKVAIAFSTVENKSLTKNQQILNSHLRKVTYSNSKPSSKSSCLLTYASVQNLKPLTPEKKNLMNKVNATKDTVILNNKLFRKLTVAKTKSTSLSKVKTPTWCNSSKSKFKTPGTKYSKVNKPLAGQKRTVQLKNVQKMSAKKIKKKVNTKYKVINKTSTPWFNKKKLNSRSGSECKDDSPIAVAQSKSFFQNLNDSIMDKLEKDLLASMALTSTPTSSETTISSYETCGQHSLTKVNLTSFSKKMPLKRSKARMSRYKIVNSVNPQGVFLKKNLNFSNLKTRLKKADYSNTSLENKRLKSVHMLTPLKQGKSVLVKRLFKSKNTIINKNTTNYSAKMIKSKYITLNKRKSIGCQKHTVYAKVPSRHNKFKGYYLKNNGSYLHNRYQKDMNFSSRLKVIRKFPNHGCTPLNRRYKKVAGKDKYKRKSKEGYVHSPVVFIHGMRYSLNSSGKTLKKLPAKGQTTKSLKRNVLKRIPENTMRAWTPNSSIIASRVLHRSINRILSASTKKKLTKCNTYCMFYNRFGRCNRGVKCTYIHDPSKIAVCTRFQRGTCKIDGCPFSHVCSPGKMAICSYFLVGACEKENCPYRHEQLLPDAVLCKAFVQGYCSSGIQCEKAHVLICPKYILGDCDKGNSCAFPHPPKKVKKNVQKDEEGMKPDDALLEKVSRYFLQTEECLSHQNKSDTTDVANQFVPKRRKLEEQPSFIPLFDTPVESHND